MDTPDINEVLEALALAFETTDDASRAAYTTRELRELTGWGAAKLRHALRVGLNAGKLRRVIVTRDASYSINQTPRRVGAFELVRAEGNDKR